MIGLLRSDFYKLFRTKAFYICGILAAALAALDVIMVNSTMDPGMQAYASLMGYSGTYALARGIVQVNLFAAIMISMFIPNEFSFGTIKNIASRGISRANIYLSKVIAGAVITIIYTVVCAAVSFTAGSIMWGTGELTRAIYLDISRMLGLFLLAEISLQCIFVMIGFFVRRTGGTVATNLGIIMIVPTLISLFINYAALNWFKFENFLFEKYWPSTYTATFASLYIDQADINIGLIVCACYIVASIAVGIFFFYKRDIK